MAINPVLARIDVMVNGQATLDRLAQGYINLENRAQAAQRGVAQWDQTHGSLLRNLGTVGSAFGMFSDRINRNIADMKAHSTGMRGSSDAAGHFEGTITSLTKSMILFGTLLPLIHLPAQFLGEMKNATVVAGDWQHQMIGVRQLLNDMSDTQFDKMNTQLQQMSVKWGLATSDMEAARKIMSTSNVVADDLNNRLDDQAKKLFLVDSAAKLAQATSTDLSKSWDTLATIAATLHLNTTELPQALDLMKESIKSGRNTMEDFNSAGSRFLPMWSNIINAGPTAEKMDRLNQLFTLYSQMSMSLGAEGAATAMGQVARNIEKPNAAFEGVIQQIMALKSAGKTLLDIRPVMFAQNGPAKYVQDISDAISKAGPIVDKFIQMRNERLLRSGQPAMNAAQEDAARITEQNHLEMIMFGAKSARGIVSVADKAQYDEILAQRNADLASGSPTDRSAEMANQDLVKQEQRREAAIQRVQIGIVGSVMPLLTQANSKVADLMSSMVDTEQFQRADVLEKIKLAVGTLMGAFADWFHTGGKAQVGNVAYELTVGIADAIKGFVGNGKGQSIFGEVGHTIADAIGAGIKDSMPGIVTSAITGSVGEGIIGFTLARKLGLGVVPSVAAGVGGAALGQGAAGGPGQILAAILGIGAAGVLGKGALDRAAASRIPLIGETAGGVLSGIGNMFQKSGAQQALAGLGLFGVRDARGRFVNSGMGGPTGYYARTRAAAAPGPTRARLGVGIGGGLLTAGLNALDVLQAPEDERGRAIAQAVGSTAGTILGGIGGGLLTAGLGGEFVGGAAGGIAGNWLGGTIYDQFQPGGLFGGPRTGGKGGIAQETVTVGDPGVQTLIQAQVLALNASEVNTKLGQLLNVSNRNGPATANRPGSNFTGGGTSYSGGGISATVDAGTIASAFTSQYGDKLLSPQEADAACGPAAVAFFAKAFGRTPTLRESVDLAKKFGWTTGGGLPNVGKAGEMLTSMGVENQVSMGSVDWNRLQSGVGIVNIGPNGNFPGHYFQIGGYDPKTGAYNVGPSGSMLKGGNAQMTRAQMDAFGPESGAVYSVALGPQPNPSIASGNDPKSKVLPLAMKLQQTNGIPWQVTMAIAGNETGYGTSGVGKMNNLFGMQGPNGDGRFAGYSSIDQSVNAFGDLMNNPRYAKALALGKTGNVNGMIEELRNAHYVVDEPGFPAQGWVNQVEGIAQGLSGGGKGGAVDSEVLGGSSGGVYVNGPLIGTAMLNSDQDINDVAEKLYVALQRVARGGMSSQHDQIKP